MGYQLTPEAQAIVGALQNPRWDWRTVGGISSDTGIPAQRVADILRGLLAGQIVAINRKGGDMLYTTRERYMLKQPIFARILSALSDRIK